MKKAEKRVVTAIVLEGGDALGAYEIGALKALYEARPDFEPAVVAGISSGGLNACLLAGAGLAPLEAFWRDCLAVKTVDTLLPLGTSIYRELLSPLAREGVDALLTLGHPAMFRLRPEYFYQGLIALWTTESTYDPKPLREALQQQIDFETLNSSDIRVVLSAVNGATGRPATFGNATAIHDWESTRSARSSPFANAGSLSVDHILASSAFAPRFPPVWIDGTCYLDGGLHHSLPILEAIEALQNYPAEESVEREVIAIEAIPVAGAAPANTAEALERSLFILLGNKIDLGEDLFIGQGIDCFTRIPFTAGLQLASSGDYTVSAIEARIEAGYREAKEREIGECHRITGSGISTSSYTSDASHGPGQ